MSTIFTSIVVLSLYFLPCIIAFAIKNKNIISVAKVNILFGWTYLGWLIALDMACSNEIKK